MESGPIYISYMLLRIMQAYINIQPFGYEQLNTHYSDISSTLKHRISIFYQFTLKVDSGLLPIERATPSIGTPVGPGGKLSGFFTAYEKTIQQDITKIAIRPTVENNNSDARLSNAIAACFVIWLQGNRIYRQELFFIVARKSTDCITFDRLLSWSYRSLWD